MSQNSSQNEPSELVAVVDDLLNQLSTKFSKVSGEILTKSMPAQSCSILLVADAVCSGRDVEATGRLGNDHPGWKCCLRREKRIGRNEVEILV